MKGEGILGWRQHIYMENFLFTNVFSLHSQTYSSHCQTHDTQTCLSPFGHFHCILVTSQVPVKLFSSRCTSLCLWTDVVSQAVTMSNAIRLSTTTGGRLITWTGMYSGSLEVSERIQISGESWDMWPHARTKTSVSQELVTTCWYPQANVSLACKNIGVSASSVVLPKWGRCLDVDEHTILMLLKPLPSTNSQSGGSSEQLNNSLDRKAASSDLLGGWLMNFFQVWDSVTLPESIFRLVDGNSSSVSTSPILYWCLLIAAKQNINSWVTWPKLCQYILHKYTAQVLKCSRIFWFTSCLD